MFPPRLLWSSQGNSLLSLLFELYQPKSNIMFGGIPIVKMMQRCQPAKVLILFSYGYDKAIDIKYYTLSVN